MKKNKKKIYNIIICILMLLIIMILFCGFKYISTITKNEGNRSKFYSVENLSSLGLLHKDFLEGIEEITILEEDGDSVYLVAEGNTLEQKIKVKVNGVDGKIEKSYLIEFCGPNSSGWCTSFRYQLLVVNTDGEVFSAIFRDGNFPVNLTLGGFLLNSFVKGDLNEKHINQLIKNMENIKFKKISSKYKIKDIYRLVDMCGYNCNFKSVVFDGISLEFESIFVETEEGILLKLNDYSYGKTIDYYLPYILKYESKLAMNSAYNLFVFNNKKYSVTQVTHEGVSIVVDSIVPINEEMFYIFDINGYVYNLELDYNNYKVNMLKKYNNYEILQDDIGIKINYIDGMTETINFDFGNSEYRELEYEIFRANLNN